MYLPSFELKIGRLLLHNKEQWDLEKYPLLCGHWYSKNKCTRFFCFGRNEGHNKYEKLYYELIMSVGNKYHGETRHETALRYIRNAEKINEHAYASSTEIT